MSSNTIISAGDFGRAAYDQAIKAINQSRRNPLVVMPTGATPKSMQQIFQRLGCPRPFQYLNLDQYCGIDFDDPRSYPLEIQKSLLDPAGLPLNMNLVFNAKADPVKECARIEREIKKAGGIDVAILGIGSNGHIGFNEPGTPFNSRAHVTELAPETRNANAAYCDHYGGVPDHAMTLGLETIMEARRVILLTNKADITRKALREEITEDVPASILQRHPNLTVVATPAVARALRFDA